ncbi:helicase-related protein [Luteococcus sp. Sow4_B9]|uniref:helicase-related protein n=1 Tax=Luteococcus sp. Sow4_B9 TaxID=3438792 RepID=UPI003F9D9534
MTATLAPGSIVVVRDEEWLVTQVRQTSDGQLITVQGLGELVRGTSATFYESLDTIEVLDPRDATLVADGSPRYQNARLWLESTIRKTPLPLTDQRLTVSKEALADPLEYQHNAVRKALSPEALRPRILLADAVGLGKTLEIGMILSELIRRGRGERILTVCPRHVLEQMQNEMWSRFAIPFVRLDSVGVQRVKQKLPATRNPFTFFNRVIISMDTLKQERFASDLRRHRWDAVVIDESHNVTNSSTQNNRLARVLAPNTDALILASATPHNGRKESFAELVRLLEPTAVTPDGELIDDEVKRLVVRRHRNSDDVARVVGADWAERKPPQHIAVTASPAEDAVAQELADVWLHPKDGPSPYSGQVSTLFPWTLAKAYLSSPAALRESLKERLRKVENGATDKEQTEARALRRLQELNDATWHESGKFDELAKYLKSIKVTRTGTNRAVVFAERVPTLHYVQQRLIDEQGFREEQVAILHGGLSDVEQQEIVDSFKQTTSPIRVLVTGDVASEGVNLHKQCHELIHYDIPWSLIRIEQRNGRIDRYGQRENPQITSLLLIPSAEDFSGDVRILHRLLEKEDEAHAALGDAASLMGEYSAEREEEAIKRVLAGKQDLDSVVRSVSSVQQPEVDSITALFAQLAQAAPSSPPQAEPDASTHLYASSVDFLREALVAAYQTPEATEPAGGVSWQEMPDEDLVAFQPPKDLQQRLEVLPQSYLEERKVRDRLLLATSKRKGKELLEAALSDASDSSWPEALYLSPQHPVLDWAADKALANLARNQVFVVRGDVTSPTLLLVGTLTNRHGQTVAASWVNVTFPNPVNPAFAMAEVVESPADLFRTVGFASTMVNPGACANVEQLQPLVRHGVDQAESQMNLQMEAAEQEARARIHAWSERTSQWQQQANELAQRLDLKERRLSVLQEEELIRDMAPTQRLVRPLLLVLPQDHAVSEGSR